MENRSSTRATLPGVLAAVPALAAVGTPGTTWWSARRTPGGAAGRRTAGRGGRTGRSRRGAPGCGPPRRRRSGSRAGSCRRGRCPAGGPSAGRRAAARRLGAGDPPGRRVHAGVPQRLVGVDVADPRDHPLVEELGLHPRRAGPERPPEPDCGEGVVERLRAEVVQRREAAVVAGGHDRDPPEAARVVEVEDAPVVERPPGPVVRARPGPGTRGWRWPVMPRWMISSRPSSRPVSRYLPRRRTPSIAGPDRLGARR